MIFLRPVHGGFGKSHVQQGPHLLRGVGPAAAFGTCHHHAGRRDPGQAGETDHFPPPRAHPPRLRTVPPHRITLDEAADLTRTGDLWLFRGHTVADRAIQLTTNSPVNHVGMAVVLDDLPALMWHAELGHSLPDLWMGHHQRGAQLHDLRAAVAVWANRYGQRAWLRQLDQEVTRQAEDAALRSVARLSGTPFPSTARLAGRWVRGRARRIRRPEDAALESAYCAEVVAVTYTEMGLLPADRRPNWYDPGTFWSGDDLRLLGAARLGAEIEVVVPA
jgi:hypothetical protein